MVQLETAEKCWRTNSLVRLTNSLRRYIRVDNVSPIIRWRQASAFASGRWHGFLESFDEGYQLVTRAIF